MTRGTLRIYLGAAPGVGKTVKMLQEAQRRRSRGTDVVVGLVETHGRDYTQGQLAGLEVVRRATVEHHGIRLAELDVPAVLRRHPDVVLVDELAHRNAEGSRHERRWEDVDELLAAGIDVLSTVNVQHLESLNDVVTAITGIRQRETVPDAVVRAADQIELVDMTPEALRRRLAHGHVYAAEKVDAALSNYFRPGNLSALRELALLWLADRVDEALERYRDEHRIDRTWPTRERVVVALTGGPGQETLLRRGARTAGRGGQLLAVHVIPDTGLRDSGSGVTGPVQRLITDLGGELHTITGSDIALAILEFARGVNASQIIVGASSRSHLQRLWSTGVGDSVVAGSGDIDVLMVTHAGARHGGLRGPSIGGVGWRRQAAGWALSSVGVACLTWLLAITRDWHQLPMDVMLYLALTVLTAIVGGIWPALAAAVISSLALNWYFTPPLGTLTISQPQNVLALTVFLLVAGSVAAVVHAAARRALEARVAQHDSQILAGLAHSLMLADDPLPALLEQARDIFAARGAAVVRRGAGGRPGSTVVVSGDPPRDAPQQDVVRADAGDDHALVLVGARMDASRGRLLSAFADSAGEILYRQQLAGQAAAAAALAKDNRARTALLAAVSHDLRTPLSAIKAGVSGLRSTDVTLSEQDQRDLLEQVETSTDRLDGLIENLLDMSRIQAGSVTARRDTLLVQDVIARSVESVSVPERIRVWLPDPSVTCRADAGLTERVLANLLENAVRYSPGRQEVVITAERFGAMVEIRVVDRGPGVPEAERTGIFAAFQRYGDSPRGTGVGLGLAVARGLTETMGGDLAADDTPGGGLTMTVRLPRADREIAAPRQETR